MATEIWVNIGSGNGLLPDGTKPLPEQMLTYHQYVKSSGIHLRAILQEIPQPSVTEISLKITYLKFCSNLPGANELKYNWDDIPTPPCSHGCFVITGTLATSVAGMMLYKNFIKRLL